MPGAHDYDSLIARWRALARRARVPLRPLIRAGRDMLYYLETPALGDSGGLYLSAGIHGDEPAGTEGLLLWAGWERRLRDIPLLIFPCLNPHGLRCNTRTDADGLDINRAFQIHDHPVIAAVRRVVAGRRFAASYHLHEDYDAQGIYLYELARGRRACGRKLLAGGPVDRRRKIERRPAKGGIVQGRVTPRTFAKIGLPEAVWLFFEHTDHAVTFETPSEDAIADRESAHAIALERFVEHHGFTSRERT